MDSPEKLCADGVGKTGTVRVDAVAVAHVQVGERELAGTWTRGEIRAKGTSTRAYVHACVQAKLADL